MYPGADWTIFPSDSVALSKELPGPVVPGFQNLVAMKCGQKRRSGCFALKQSWATKLIDKHI